MILGNLLPGFRDFRTPLAIGFLWLSSIWTIWGEQLTDAVDDETSLPGRVSHLAFSLPGGALLSALVFSSYLIGAALMLAGPPNILDRSVNHTEGDGENYAQWIPFPEPFRLPLGQLSRLLPRWVQTLLRRGLIALEPHAGYRLDNAGRRFRGWLRPPLSFDGISSPIRSMLEMKVAAAAKEGATVDEIVASNATSTYVREWMSEVLAHGWTAMGAVEPEDAEYQRQQSFIQSIIDSTHRDLPAVATRVHIQQPLLYDRYDRLRAESEFRLGVSLPLFVLILAVCFATSQPLVLLILPFPFLLFLQGWKRRYEADSLLWEALLQGLVTAPDIQVLDAFAGSVPITGQPDSDEAASQGQ